MHSKRSHEGYLLIDHRESPGVPDALLHALGVPMPLGAGQGLFEAPTITCSHCQTVLILNPLRTRERAYCAKCDHYICDGCGAALAQSGVCTPFRQVIETVQNQAATGGGHPLSIP
jgi:hypothetical protein